MNKHLSALFLFFIMSLPSLSADRFRVIDNNNGLSDNSVNCIRQDENGFIWMGTANGLCRYDGLSFTTFRNNPADPTTIFNNNVRAMLSVRGGLWVSTNGAMLFYSFHDGVFHHVSAINSKGKQVQITSQMNSLISIGGNIVCANGNMYVKHGGDDKFSVLPYLVNSLCTYQDKYIVGVGTKGVFLFSKDGKRMIAGCKFNFNATAHASIYYSRNSGLVYVGNGIGQRSYVFRVIGNHIVPADAYVPDNLMAVTDYRHNTVFGVDGGGIIEYAGGKKTQYTSSNSNLCGDAVYSLLADRGGNLWIGTYRAGVSQLSLKRNIFQMLNRKNGSIPYDIVTAVVPAAGSIYMGLDGGGLCIYDRHSGTSRTLTTDNSNIAGNNVISMVKDGPNLWMAVYTRGLALYSTQSGGFSLYTMPAGTIGNNNVWTLCDDGIGRIWAGGPDLFVFDKRTRKFAHTREMLGMDCASMACRGNYIWIGSNHNGIYKMDKRSMKVVDHYTSTSRGIRIDGNEVRSVFIDSRGRLWFSLYYAGFYCLDEKTLTVHKYGAGDGLANTYVTSVSEDRSGALWMGTYDGLFKFNPKTRTFVRFGADEDISSTFTYNAATTDGDDMYFGSTKGLLAFNPLHFNYQRHYDGVDLLLLELQNDNQRVFNLYGQQHPEISLAHDQNFFSIRFSVPEMDSPNSVHFSCYLKGLEQGWRMMGGERNVSYTNVPPGHYEFYVRCTDSNGQWGRPTVLSITITPPWYATWLALLLWSLIVVGIIVAAFKLYLYELDIKHRVQIVEVQRNTMKRINEAKMNFYTYVTHELRTPVFLIGAQIEELMGWKTSPVQVPQSYLESMHRNTTKLNRLISRVIDFHKMDANATTLNLQLRNVVTFCMTLSEDYANLCAQKHITYKFHCDSNDIRLAFDLDKLETILTNLVSNAFKYTNENGDVTLSVEERPDEVVFTVADNGIGIIEKMRDAIFQNFVRTERGEAKSQGDGVGLASVKSLVELHGGTIHVESEVDSGTRFVFSIPKKTVCDDVTDIEPVNMSATSADETTPSSVVPANPAATHSILVIDDEQDTVDLLERNLSSDFKVFKAHDGEQGLTVARAELPDIIICDLMMPNMDGMQFLQTLKNDKTLQHIKVIIFTAKTSEDDMIQAYDNGADAYLTKPISLKYLRKRIDRLVAQADSANVTNDISREKKSYNKEEQIFLLRCREIIDDNLQSGDFSIDYLADHLAMSHSSLYKKIKAMTGMSLIEFINDYKIYKATQLFKQGVTSVDSVSDRCGFKDVKNFRETFKRKMNVTPKQYVQSL